MRQQLACDRARHLVKTLAALVLVMSFGVPAVSQEASAPDGSSAEMKQIFDADQADREVNMAAMTPHNGWTGLAKSVLATRSGANRSWISFRAACYTRARILTKPPSSSTHGDNPDDYLLAHIVWRRSASPKAALSPPGSPQRRWIVIRKRSSSPRFTERSTTSAQTRATSSPKTLTTANSSRILSGRGCACRIRRNNRRCLAS